VASVPWIRLYTSFPRHRKTMLLIGKIGTAMPILSLWCWAAENAPDGDLSAFTRDQIEQAAEWRGESGKAIQAMIDVGYIDENKLTLALTLASWLEHSGQGVSRLTSRRDYQKNLMREIRAKEPSSPSALPSEEDPDKSKKKSKSKRVSHLVSANGFDEFYKAYPRHIGRGQAERAWPGDDHLPAILVALKWQKPGWSDPQYIPHPATWLRGKRWLDEKPTQQALLIQRPPRDIRVGHVRAEDCNIPEVSGVLKDF
jgi:hypothetical protein